jgi:hypothetical protein
MFFSPNKHEKFKYFFCLLDDLLKENLEGILIMELIDN